LRHTVGDHQVLWGNMDVDQLLKYHLFTLVRHQLIGGSKYDLHSTPHCDTDNHKVKLQNCRMKLVLAYSYKDQ